MWLVIALLAEVKASPLAFGSMFRDGAVLQRGGKVTVWGNAPPAVDVQLTLSPVRGGAAHSQVRKRKTTKYITAVCGAFCFGSCETKRVKRIKQTQ